MAQLTQFVQEYWWLALAALVGWSWYVTLLRVEW